MIGSVGSEKAISGEEAFKLYDTYGFPIDLTQLIARENNIEVDEEGFHLQMLKQKEKARESGKFKLQDENINWTQLSAENDSEFVGYEYLKTTSKVTKYSEIENGYIVVLDKTTLCRIWRAAGDIGSISFDGNELNVIDVQKQSEMIVHICKGDVSSWNKSSVMNV